MDFIEGGDPGPLHELIKKFATDLTPSVPSPVAGQIDLSAFFNKASAECLNEKDTHTLLQMVDGRNVLESDCDEQLIINIPFNVPVKIHSIEIKGKNGHAPKNVKVFANIISTLDFDRAESSEPTQALDFSQNTLQSLRFVKFQNVNNIQLFIANNTGDDDVTIVESIRFYGQPSGATNMQDFKRVSHFCLFLWFFRKDWVSQRKPKNTRTLTFCFSFSALLKIYKNFLVLY